MRHYKCQKCGHRWNGPLALFPRCPKCGSYHVWELQRPKRDEYFNDIQSDLISGDMGL